eukprot:1860804-Rhodomonas_salina.2
MLVAAPEITVTWRQRQQKLRQKRTSHHECVDATCGAFMHAMAICSFVFVMTAATAGGEAKTTSIAPVGGSVDMRAARFTTIASPSCQLSAPAATDAANSPKLWPTTVWGVTPSTAQACVSATCTA